MYTIPLPVDWPLQNMVSLENLNIMDMLKLYSMFQTPMIVPCFTSPMYLNTTLPPSAPMSAAMTNMSLTEMPINASKCPALQNQSSTTPTSGKLPFGIDAILSPHETAKPAPPTPSKSTPSQSSSPRSTSSTSTSKSSSPPSIPKRRGKFTPKITEFLTAWFEAHLENPYVEGAMDMLMAKTQLTRKQIAGWFMNRRRDYNNARNGCIPWVKRSFPQAKRAKTTANDADEPPKKRARKSKPL